MSVAIEAIDLVDNLVKAKIPKETAKKLALSAMICNLVSQTSRFQLWV